MCSGLRKAGQPLPLQAGIIQVLSPSNLPESEAHHVTRFLSQNCRHQTDRDFPNPLFGIPQRPSRWK
jgi:hypothetical protein